MTRIRVDDVLRSKLHNFTEPIEICDDQGNVLAWLEPAPDPSQFEPREPQISEEELQRREKSTEWYTTEQVLAHLKKLEEENK
jgi:hypothetical protein